MANTETPLMRQYLQVKEKHKDCLLFFRLGDFYELFFGDATTAARELEITLTTRNKNDPDPVPMCGVPYHSSQSYINKLIARGYKVAVCEQLEDPETAKALGKKIVERDVVRIITPGTQFDPDGLESKSSNFTLALTKDGSWSACDYTTGLLYFGSVKSNSTSTFTDELKQFLSRMQPAEILVPLNSFGETFQNQIKSELVPEFYFDQEYALKRIEEQFGTTQTESIHPQLKSHVGCIGALIKYFQSTQKTDRIPGLFRVYLYGQDQRMDLDAATIRSLELLPVKNTGADVSLLTLVDRTRTAMGGRLLRDWLTRPFTDLALLTARLNEVEALTKESTVENQKQLSSIYDFERLITRIGMGLANARDLRALSDSILNAYQYFNKIKGIPALAASCKNTAVSFSSELLEFANHTLRSLVDLPPILIRDGGLFTRGYHAELDELIELSTNGEEWLTKFEARERAATGISSLKVRFNRVFGYYIEITKSNLASAPSHYIRKQTMVGGERYITEELKSFEEKILSSEKKRQDLELELFKKLCTSFLKHRESISKISEFVAYFDVIESFAETALKHAWIKPTLHSSDLIQIQNGRHPTVSVLTPHFVSNSIELSDKTKFLLITGPNMGGKSTVMRQTALIVLLAQMGSFVPASRADIGLVDRVFTRIGSSDNIAEGASTFMVEMNEMSYILRNATDKSLILLDEIGRGTSTFDGMSIAWALASDIATRIGSRTMFATHYHELTELAHEIPFIKNFRMGVKVDTADGGTIQFLYKLESGAAERSYGILVAKKAGLPSHVLELASSVLEELENQSHSHKTTLQSELPLFQFASQSSASNTKQDSSTDSGSIPKQDPRLLKTDADLEISDRLIALDINTLTPIEALNELASLSKKKKEENEDRV